MRGKTEKNNVEKALALLDKISDGEARFYKINRALSSAYDALPFNESRIARRIMELSVSQLPKRKPSAEQAAELKRLHYWMAGRCSDCLSPKDIEDYLYSDFDADNSSTIKRKLKVLCDGFVIHRFSIRIGDVIGTVFTYNRHTTQWVLLREAWRKDNSYTLPVMPCTIKSLAEPVAYKHAAFVMAHYLMKNVTKNRDWKNIDVGVEQAKRIYFNEFLWGLICKASPDVRAVTPRLCDTTLTPDEYAVMVVTVMGKFDPWHGDKLGPDLINSLALPRKIKSALVKEMNGEFSDHDRKIFYKAFLCSDKVGEDCSPVPDEIQEDGGEYYTPSTARLVNGDHQPDNGGEHRSPCSTIETEDNYMQDNELGKQDETPLRINQTRERITTQEWNQTRADEGRNEGEVATLEPNQENHEDCEMPEGSYNADMQEDKSISPDQVKRDAFSVPAFTPDHPKRPSSKSTAKKERYPGQDTVDSLHRHVVKKEKDSQKAPPTILNDTRLFIDTYHRIVSEECGRANFPKAGALGVESDSAHKALDLLKNQRCFDENILLGWMRYSGRQFKKLRRTITVGMMRDTWAGYSKIKPNVRTGPAGQSSKQLEVVERDHISISMSDIFSSGTRRDAIWTACGLWGVVLTAQWLAKIGSVDVCSEIKECLSSRISTPAGKTDVRDVFSATLRWEEATSKYAMPMSDWKDKLSDVVKAVGPFQPYPQRGREKDYVATFFGKLGGKVQ